MTITHITHQAIFLWWLFESLNLLVYGNLHDVRNFDNLDLQFLQIYKEVFSLREEKNIALTVLIVMTTKEY